MGEVGINRETEDAQSIQLKVIYKDYDKQRFQEQIRRDVEARKAAELAEREARRKAAEERRAAVVERIRKQQEMEEKRKRDAELALLRIQEEKERKEQEERDRLLSDQAKMSMEDQLSALVEQDYREHMERQKWKQREKEKLIEWERQQREKDILEEEERKKRMVELEEKKRKLEALKKQQQQANANQGKSEQQMKEEGDRINRQLRIQNRAKFVSKKISGGATAESASSEVAAMAHSQQYTESHASHVTDQPAPIPTAASTTAPIAEDGDSNKAPPVPSLRRMMSKAASMKNLDDVIFVNKPTATSAAAVSATTTVAPITEKVQISMESPEIKMYLAKINAIDSDAKLREIQKELMSKKRDLKVELRQKASETGATVSAEEEQNFQLKFQEIDIKHDIIDKKLADLRTQAVEVTDHNHEVQAPEVEAEKGMMSRGKSFKRLSSQKISLSAIPEKAVAQAQTSSGVSAHATTASVSNHQGLAPHPSKSTISITIPDQQDEKFKQIEIVLRTSQKLLTSLEIGDLDSVVSVIKSHSSQLTSNSSTLHEAVTRQLTGLVLEITQVVKEVKKDYDPLGYIDKLHETSKKLQLKLADLEQHPIAEPLESVVKVTLTAAASTRPVTSPRPNSPKTHPGTMSIVSPSAPSSLISSASVPNIASHPTPTKVLDLSSPVTSFHEDSLTTPAMDIEKVEANLDIPQVNDADMAEEDIVDPTTLPGWEDCIYTSMFTAAHHAAFFGYVDVLKFLIQFFDCFIMDQKGRTPLFYACIGNRLECVATLLSIDPQWIDVGDEKGDTPLHAAAISNSVQVLAFLLSCEAHPDTANYMGLTPSHLARNQESLQILFEAGATLYCVDNASHMPIWYACAENRLDCVRFLCQKTPKDFLFYADEEGDTCLHKASMAGHGGVMEILCEYVTKTEDMSTPNKKTYTPAHVATNASVLKALYENGANLWSFDSKQHMPLFLASFHGRTECVSFLLDVGTKNRSSPTGGASPRPSPRTGGSSPMSPPPSTGQVSIHEGIVAKDKQGDTALHVASLCGHIACVSLLLYFVRNESNKQGLTPAQLAVRAGHNQVAALIEHYEHVRSTNPGFTSLDIFGTDFNTLSVHILYYGSRWSLAYDDNFDSVYYYDNPTMASQWNKPEAFDMTEKEEHQYTQALAIIKMFYQKYNPEKMKDLNVILSSFRGRYTELFINLANKYNVEDLSMFKGVNFD